MRTTAEEFLAERRDIQAREKALSTVEAICPLCETLFHVPAFQRSSKCPHCWKDVEPITLKELLTDASS